MFYLCLVITVFSPVAFAQDTIEECYSSTCMLPNNSFSFHKALTTNCASPTPLTYFWWYRKGNIPIQLNINPNYFPYINNSIPFVLLLPGLGESITSTRTTQIKNAYFDNNGTIPTVIEANYNAGRDPSTLYLPPPTDCGYLKIADEVAELLYKLNSTYDFQIECMHLIGISFGAHIAGMVGNLLKGKYNYTLGRITGLDPLGAGYNCVTCKSLRLNKGDAKFVDVIHTNPGRIGELRRVGDIDFYVNWPYYWSYKTDFYFRANIDHGQLVDTGRRDANFYYNWPSWIQPGCHNASDPDTCSSLRSAALYAESIRYQNFRATSCHSLVRFSECFPTDYTYMGLYAKPSRYGVYYVATNSNPPYGMGPPGPTPEGFGPCSCVEMGCRATASGELANKCKRNWRRFLNPSRRNCSTT